MQLAGGRGKFKLPTLTELHQHLFNKPFAQAHNATVDVEATTRCFLELLEEGIIQRSNWVSVQIIYKSFKPKYEVIAPLGLKHRNLKKASLALAA